MEIKQDSHVDIDVRTILPSERHQRVFDQFLDLKDGQELHVIVDHDPKHLLEHMKHQGLPVDADAYRTVLKDDGTFVGIFRKLEKNGNSSGVKITSIGEARNYLPNRFNPVSLYSGENYKIIATYIKAGQFIPVHAPSTDLVFAVFKGTGTMFAGNGEVDLFPGRVVIVPGGQKRGVRAVTDIEALHIVSPIPGEVDHLEVMEKLQANRYL